MQDMHCAIIDLESGNTSLLELGKAVLDWKKSKEVKTV